MSRTRKRSPAVVVLLVLLFSTGNAWGQSRIPDQYLKKDKLSMNPMSFSIHVGWGFFPEGKEMRPLFAGTQNTTYGGPHFAVQALFPMPWVWDHLTLGLDAWYHRIAKRYLAYVEGVYYTAGRGEVYADETVSGFGVTGISDILVAPQWHIQLGGGMIYLSPSKLDVPQEITGLFPATIEPVAMGAVTFSVTRYEHGSVDLSLRVLKEFGEYNNLLIQMSLGFAFKF